MPDENEMPISELYDRVVAGIAHDFGPPPPRYTSERLQADIWKLGCDLNRMAAGATSPNETPKATEKK